MIGLLQRVVHAEVVVAHQSIGRIGTGLLVFVCAERGDRDEQADRLLERLLACRVFSDTAGRMNRSLRDINGGLLLVPQFTLAADTRKGNRPSFRPAASPEEGHRLFDYMVARATAAPFRGGRPVRRAHGRLPHERWPGHDLAGCGCS